MEISLWKYLSEKKRVNRSCLSTKLKGVRQWERFLKVPLTRSSRSDPIVLRRHPELFQFFYPIRWRNRGLLLITNSARCNYPLRSHHRVGGKAAVTRRPTAVARFSPCSWDENANRGSDETGRCESITGRSVPWFAWQSARLESSTSSSAWRICSAVLKAKSLPFPRAPRTHRRSIRAFTDPHSPLTPAVTTTLGSLCRTHRDLHGIPSCSRPGKLRALIKFSLGTLTELGPSFIKRRIKVIFP